MPDTPQTPPVGQLTRPLSWKEVAQRLGEQLTETGPNGYYGFTPTEWLDWALKVVGEQGKGSWRTWPSTEIHHKDQP